MSCAPMAMAVELSWIQEQAEVRIDSHVLPSFVQLHAVGFNTMRYRSYRN